MDSQPGLRRVGKAQCGPEPLRALVRIGDLPSGANRAADRGRIVAVKVVPLERIVGRRTYVAHHARETPVGCAEHAAQLIRKWQQFPAVAETDTEGSARYVRRGSVSATAGNCCHFRMS